MEFSMDQPELRVQPRSGSGRVLVFVVAYRAERHIESLFERVPKELLNSDATAYGGSGLGNYGEVEACAMECHDLPFSVNLTLPPLSVLFLEVPAADTAAENDDAS